MMLLPLAATSDVLGNHQTPGREQSSQPKVKIRNVRAILTAPYRTNLVIVKVETDQDGLYGIGCATFTQRAHTVVSAINDYLSWFMILGLTDKL